MTNNDIKVGCIVILDQYGAMHAHHYPVTASLAFIRGGAIDFARTLAFDAGEQLVFGVSTLTDPGAARLDGRNVRWLGRFTA